MLINIHTPQGNNRFVLLEINEKKENVEIVHWHFVDERGIEKIKRQAQREDGQLLILPLEETKEAGALSSPTQDLSSKGEDTHFTENHQTHSEKTTKEKSAPTSSRTDVASEPKAKLDDTATQQNADSSATKVDNSAQITKQNNQNNALQEREDEEGNRILYQMGGGVMSGDGAEDELATQVALDLLSEAGVEVEMVSDEHTERVLSMMQGGRGNATRGVDSEHDDRLAVTTLPADTSLPITEISGDEISLEEVREAIASLPSQVHTLDGHTLSVSKKTRSKLINELSNHKEDNATQQALANLQEIVANSLLIEEHSDHVKVDGERKVDNPSDRNVEKVQRFYGAVSINGETYRAKTTAVVFYQGNNRIRGYEVTKIELLPEKTTRSSKNRDVAKGSNSITLANLLQGIDFSYENGRKIVDEQQKNSETPDFQLAWHGSPYLFDHFDHSYIGSGQGDSAFGWGTYVTELREVGESYAEQALFNSQKRGGAKLSVAFVQKSETQKGQEAARVSELKKGLYSVEIPDNNGKNYLLWEKRAGLPLIKKVVAQMGEEQIT